ncbi:MAG: M20/M25/M40 family metallo-hydrolase [Bacteroidota bacterium]
MKKLTFPLFMLLFLISSLSAQQQEPKTVIDLDSLTAALTQQVDSNQIRSYMQGLEDFGSRLALNENRHEVALWIETQFREMGFDDSETALHPFDYSMQYFDSLFHTTQYNVSARLPGITDTVVVVGAHHDSHCFNMQSYDDLAPGANDNASGSAGVLELARVFKQNNIQPYYTLLFVTFAAEEYKLSAETDGAQEFVDELIAKEKHVHYMLNLDMIANDDLGWKGLYVNRSYSDKNNDNWLFERIDYLSSEYTDLLIFYDKDAKDSRTDDWPFSDAGFNTMYFAEYDFSPNYHSTTDLVENCELDFAAEVVKLSAGVLIDAAVRPDPMHYAYVVNDPNGESLRLKWKKSKSQISYYLVRYGKEKDNWIEELEVQDTSLVYNQLEPDEDYFFEVEAISAINTPSLTASASGKLLTAPMDQGILVVNVSDTNLAGVTNDSIDKYYEYLTDRFVVTSIQADTAADLSMELFADYSTVILHNESREPEFRITQPLQNIFRGYLDIGGHLLLTLYRPTLMFENDYGHGLKLNPHKFFSEKLLVDSVMNYPNTVFHYITDAETQEEIRVDENKLESKFLIYVETYDLLNNAEIQWQYGSDFDSTVVLGSYQGYPVGLFNPGDNKNLFLTGVPFYYLEQEAGQELMHNILRNKFGEFYVDVPEIEGEGQQARVYPNPVKEQLHISWNFQYEGEGQLEVFDNEGRRVMEQSYAIKASDRVISLNTNRLQTGICLYKITLGTKVLKGKFIVKE